MEILKNTILRRANDASTHIESHAPFPGQPLVFGISPHVVDGMGSVLAIFFVLSRSTAQGNALSLECFKMCSFYFINQIKYLSCEVFFDQ